MTARNDRPPAAVSALKDPAGGAWDQDLPRFVREIRAVLHTTVRWQREPSGFAALTACGPGAGGPQASDHVGALDGAAGLGPMRGWAMMCRVHPVEQSGRGWGWQATVSARLAGGEPAWLAFRVGPRAGATVWPTAGLAKQSFEDLCRGADPGGYRVQADDGSWLPLWRLQSLAEAAREGTAPRGSGASGPARSPATRRGATLPRR